MLIEVPAKDQKAHKYLESLNFQKRADLKLQKKSTSQMLTSNEFDKERKKPLPFRVATLMRNSSGV